MNAQSHGSLATLPPSVSPRDELDRLLGIAVNRFLQVFTERCADNIGRRLEAWSGAVVLPKAGMGDLAAVAATLDVSVDGARKHLERNGLSGTGGTRKFYNLAELSLTKSSEV